MLHCTQHLVTKSGTVWSQDHYAMAEHALYWDCQCWDTKYLVQPWTHGVINHNDPSTNHCGSRVMLYIRFGFLLLDCY